MIRLPDSGYHRIHGSLLQASAPADKVGFLPCGQYPKVLCWTACSMKRLCPVLTFNFTILQRFLRKTVVEYQVKSLFMGPVSYIWPLNPIRSIFFFSSSESNAGFRVRAKTMLTRSGRDRPGTVIVSTWSLSVWIPILDYARRIMTAPCSKVSNEHDDAYEDYISGGLRETFSQYRIFTLLAFNWHHIVILAPSPAVWLTPPMNRLLSRAARKVVRIIDFIQSKQWKTAYSDSGTEPTT